MRRLPLAAASALSLFLVGASAFAQDADDDSPRPPPPPAAPAPPQPWIAPPSAQEQPVQLPGGPVIVPRNGQGPLLPPNVNVGPGGGVTVTQTPGGPVDVHAPTPDGMVHAYGCSKVSVDPSTRAPGVAYPPPCPAPYYAPYPVYMVPYYAPQYAYYPPSRPRYEPDPSRTTALVVSSLAFGLGTLGAGTSWIVQAAQRSECGAVGSCRSSRGGEETAKYAYGAFVSLPASFPRFVMGDVGMGLLLSGLRVGSFLVGADVNWKDNWAGPLTLAFAAPVALSIIDLATTPHREQMQRRAQAKSSFQLDSIGPSVAFDKTGAAVPAVAALGRF